VIDRVDRTLTTLRKKRATGTGNHILLIFHRQKARLAKRRKRKENTISLICESRLSVESPDQIRARDHAIQGIQCTSQSPHPTYSSYPRIPMTLVPIDQSGVQLLIDSTQPRWPMKGSFSASLTFPFPLSDSLLIHGRSDLAPPHPSIWRTTSTI